MTALALPQRAEIEKVAKKHALQQQAQETAERAAVLRQQCETVHEADALRRELHGLIGVFQAKRIEAVECLAEERRIEAKIGELLGPAENGGDRRSPEFSALPGKAELNDRYKHEFRLMHEHVEVVEAKLAEGKVARKPVIRAVKAVAAAAARNGDLPSHEFHACSCADLAQRVEAKTVDVVITDPPYPREHLDAYSELSRFAAHALKDGGLCVALAGQSYLPEVLARLSEHLTYHWLGCYLLPGGQSSGNRGRGVNAFWKPVCIFRSGKYEGAFGDVIRSAPNDNDAGLVHQWGQSESGMLDLVRRFSRPGDLVAEPFLGSGTIAHLALLEGRRVVGSDIHNSWVLETESRIG